MGHTSVFPIAGKTISGSSCAIFTTKSPFYRQNAVDATLGVFRVDGLYLRYCPLMRKRLAAAGTVFSQQNHFIVKIVQIQRSVGLTAMGHTSVFPIAGKTISGSSCAIFTIKYLVFPI
ncbi:MAG: hypothetical protein IJ942_01070 [Alistipes sp.]|nr:hypothetical protein [Alistipes sp.]